jgi:hypothetical protein
LQQTKCSGVLPVFGSTSAAAPGFAWSVARKLSFWIGPPLVKYSRRGDIVVAMSGARIGAAVTE